MQHTSKSVMRVTKSVFCDLRQLGICNARLTHRGPEVVKDNFVVKGNAANTDLSTDYGQCCAIQIRIPTVIGHRPPPTHRDSTVRYIPRSGASACQHKQFSAQGQITSALGVNKNSLVRIKCGHVHVQPAKKSLRVCCLNPRSTKNKALSLSDYIVVQDYDVALTETWLGTSVDKKCICELVPSGYTLRHVPPVPAAEMEVVWHCFISLPHHPASMAPVPLATTQTLNTWIVI